MPLSQNGWPVLASDSSFLHSWKLRLAGGELTMTLRRGASGLVLCHLLLWFDEVVEPVLGDGDDHGWALRRIAGSTEYSNHSSGTAVDLNASQHPAGTPHTFNLIQTHRIERRVSYFFKDSVRWGGSYTHPDEMHFEINKDHTVIRTLAITLRGTNRGRAILALNPGQRQYL